MENSDYEKELERLRNEYIIRGEDKAAIWRVKNSEEHRNKPAITIEPNTAGEDGPNACYPLTLNINLYAPLQDIKEALLNEVMKKIEVDQKLLHFDNPESKIPEFEKGKGKRGPKNETEELQECLNIFDMSAAGKTHMEIAVEIYKTPRQELDWNSSNYRKVSQKINKALKLIESAENGSFPHLTRLPETK